MLRDLELAALLDQAARNLETLELLAFSANEHDLDALHDLRERLAHLKAAYTRETNALTRAVLERAVERRAASDRRRRPELQPT
jgi:hypothetical protein